MAAVAYSVEGTTAVLTVRNAPVNALSQAVREGLLVGIRRAAADGQVRGVIIAGSGQTFPAGADIREFGSAAAGQSPDLVEVCTAIEECPKPVAAAIHGTALGGGLEVALSCHYRVGAASAKVGLPEVALGILPGAGGTQRLPRLVPIDAALELILSGAPMAAAKAAALGILDRVEPAVVERRPLAVEDAGNGAPIQAAAAVLAAATAPLEARRLSHRSAVSAGGEGAALALVAKRRAKLPPAERGAAARHAICDAVGAAVSLPFAEGMALEAQLIGRLMRTPQSAALRHVFFATRAVSKLEALAPSAPTLALTLTLSLSLP